MKGLIIAVLLLLTTTTYAQEGVFQKLYVTPAVSLGITFGGLFNLGIDLDLTTSVTNDFDKIRNVGISTSYYLVLMRGGKTPHQMMTLNLMFENERIDLKGGYALMNYKWGLRKVNNGTLGGFSADVSFTNRSQRIPWIGLKTVVFNQRQWIWFDQPYFSPYAKYKFYLTGGNQ